MSADDLVRKRCRDREEYYQDLRSYERKIEQDLRSYERKIEQNRLEYEQIVAEKEKEIRQLRAQLARLENNNNS